MILGFTLLLFVGCGGSGTKEDPLTPSVIETPKSPLLENKEKTPPSIPEI